MGPHTYHLLDSSYAVAIVYTAAEVVEKLLLLTFLAASIWGAVNFFSMFSQGYSLVQYGVIQAVSRVILIRELPLMTSTKIFRFFDPLPPCQH